MYYFYVTQLNAFTFERILFISNLDQYVYRLNMVFYRPTTNKFSYKFRLNYSSLVSFDP